MVAGLSVSDVINVPIVLSPTPAALRNFGILMIVGGSNVIDTGSRVRQYSNLSQVSADFSATMPEYLAAVLFFEQNPQPSILNIGRWAKAATSGVLNGAVLNGAQQASLLSSLQGTSNGTIQFTVDGTVRNVTGLNFTAVTNLNAAASVINTALTGATVTWAPDSNARFVVSSNSTGTNSSVSYAATVGSGTDVSAMLGLTKAAGASPPVSGVLAETPLQAVQALTSSTPAFGGSYALMFADTTITDAQHIAVASYIEGMSPSMQYGITITNPAAIDATQTSDLASQLHALKFNRTVVQYSSYNPYAIASFFGRALTVDFTANNSLITMKFKTEPGITAETLTETQAITLTAKGVNVFVNYANGTAIIQQGIMASGQWFDVIYGTDWLQNDIQTDVYNLFYTNSTKIPQTDAGMHLVTTTIVAALADAVNNGLIAPGIWNAAGFGQLQQGQNLPLGYYVYATPMSSQSQTVRQTRVAPTIQVAIKLGGAIHSANVQVNVNQ